MISILLTFLKYKECVKSIQQTLTLMLYFIRKFITQYKINILNHQLRFKPLFIKSFKQTANTIY